MVDPATSGHLCHNVLDHWLYHKHSARWLERSSLNLLCIHIPFLSCACLTSCVQLCLFPFSPLLCQYMHSGVKMSLRQKKLKIIFPYTLSTEMALNCSIFLELSFLGSTCPVHAPTHQQLLLQHARWPSRTLENHWRCKLSNLIIKHQKKKTLLQ